MFGILLKKVRAPWSHFVKKQEREAGVAVVVVDYNVCLWGCPCLVDPVVSVQDVAVFKKTVGAREIDSHVEFFRNIEN